MQTAYIQLGPYARIWFKFIDEVLIETGKASLENYKMIVVSYAQIERNSVIDSLTCYVENGGILLLVDPEAFR